jgi:hypothetical protein
MTIGPEVLETKWLTFTKSGVSSSGKTNIYEVHAKSGAFIGITKWQASWRRYVFHPLNNTFFDAECLLDISKFLTKINEEHKNDR